MLSVRLILLTILFHSTHGKVPLTKNNNCQVDAGFITLNITLVCIVFGIQALSFICIITLGIKLFRQRRRQLNLPAAGRNQSQNDDGNRRTAAQDIAFNYLQPIHSESDVTEGGQSSEAMTSQYHVYNDIVERDTCPIKTPSMSKRTSCESAEEDLHQKQCIKKYENVSDYWAIHG